MTPILLLSLLTLPALQIHSNTSIDEVLELARTSAKKAAKICEEETRRVNADEAGAETAHKLLFLARYYARAENNSLADNRALKAKAIAERLGEKSLLRSIYQIEAVIASQKGQFERGIEASTKSIELSDASSPALAISLSERGICRLQFGEIKLAIIDLQKAMEIAAEIKNHRLVLHTRVNMANAYDAMNQHDRAIGINESSLSFAADPERFKRKNRRVIGTIHTNIGNSILNKMKFEKMFDEVAIKQAGSHFQAAKKTVGDSVRSIVALAETGLGDIAYLRADFEEAESRYESATKIYAQMLDLVGLALMNSRMSKVEAALEVEISKKQIESRNAAIADAKLSGQVMVELDLITSLISRIEANSKVGAHNEKNLVELLRRKNELTELRVERSCAETLQKADQSIELIEQKYAYETLQRESQFAEQSLAQHQHRNWIYFLLCVGAVVGCFFFGILWQAKVRVSRQLDEANQLQLAEHQNKAEIDKVLAQQEKLDSLTTMSAGVMHDFNNYLLAIIADAEHGGAQAGPKQMARCFQNITDSAQLASGLTKDLSNYIGAGKLTFSSRDLNQELLSVSGILQSISGNRIKFETDDSVAIPVAIDAAAFQTVVINLVKNAVEASPDGQEIVVAARLLKATNEGLLTIVDSGEGMSEELIGKVFDPFFTSKGLGRGLGLPSAKGIVESHGGQLRVIRRSIGGTEIQVLLPIADAGLSAEEDGEAKDEDLDIKHTVRPSAVDSNSAKETPSILFVDDDEMIRRAVFSILKTNYETFLASSAEEALVALSLPGHGITCVITDYSLPGFSGIELAEEVTQRFGNIPVILISGFPEKDVSESHCISEFLPKPFTLGTLRSAIERALDGKRTLKFTR